MPLRTRPDPLFVPTETVELGPAWAGNSVNCVPFRIDALLTRGGVRHAAFFDGAGDVVVIQRAVGGAWTRRHVIENAVKPRDAHQAISLGLDAAGRIHLAFGAHASRLLSTRSRTASIADGFLPVAAHEGAHTYPMFLSLGRRLVRLHREGRHDAGALYASRPSRDGAGWTRDALPLLSGLGHPWSCGPYLNTPVVDRGGRVHLFVVWRLPDGATSGGAALNAGIDALVGHEGLTKLRTHAGLDLSLPVTPATSERIVAVPLGASLMNQATATLMPDGTAAFATSWDPGDGIPQYHLGWRDRQGWRTAVISAFETRFRLEGGGTLPLPHSRPEIVAHADRRITLLYRSAESGNRLVASQLRPPDYDLRTARTQVLVDQDLGFYEPVLDRAAWRTRRELVLYVQKCEQGRGQDGTGAAVAEPARLHLFKPR